jgi:hypothetical protein
MVELFYIVTVCKSVSSAMVYFTWELNRNTDSIVVCLCCVALCLCSLLFGDMNRFLQVANKLELRCQPEWHLRSEE